MSYKNIVIEDNDSKKYINRVSNDGHNVSVTFGPKVLPPNSKIIFALSYY